MTVAGGFATVGNGPGRQQTGIFAQACQSRSAIGAALRDIPAYQQAV